MNNNTTLMPEIWRQIPQSPQYSVSNHGKVRNDTSGKILKDYRSSSGYRKVALFVGGKRIQKYLHVLVATAFCYNPDPKHKTQVNHLNCRKNENFAANLEWVTAKENNRFKALSRIFAFPTFDELIMVA